MNELNWKHLLLRLETCSSTDGLDVGEDEQLSIWTNSYSYTLSATVLTLVAPPKMFYSWYRILWSRNQLWNFTHFRHPIDEQLRRLDFLFFRLSDISSNSNLPSALFKQYAVAYVNHACVIQTVTTHEEAKSLIFWMSSTKPVWTRALFMNLFPLYQVSSQPPANRQRIVVRSVVFSV